jgi:DNA replication and repair protein RecF
VEQIVKLVSGNSFGQIFITDTNREHLDRILERNDLHYKLFEVTQGEVVERRRSSELASAEEGGENHEME